MKSCWTYILSVCPSLDKFNDSCNFVDGLSSTTCASNKTKSVNVKVFNMLTKINDAKTLIKHNSCDCKSKFDSTACSSSQK